MEKGMGLVEGVREEVAKAVAVKEGMAMEGGVQATEVVVKAVVASEVVVKGVRERGAEAMAVWAKAI